MHTDSKIYEKLEFQQIIQDIYLCIINAILTCFSHRFKGIREGGVSENSSWYVYMQGKDGAFEAYPVEEWYNFKLIQRYKSLSAEEAEKEFERFLYLHFFNPFLYFSNICSSPKWKCNKYSLLGKVFIKIYAHFYVRIRHLFVPKIVILDFVKLFSIKKK